MKLFEVAFLMHIEEKIPGIKIQKSVVASGGTSGGAIAGIMTAASGAANFAASGSSAKFVMTAPNLFCKIEPPQSHESEWVMTFRFIGWHGDNGVLTLKTDDSLTVTQALYEYTETGHRHQVTCADWMSAHSGVPHLAPRLMLEYFIVPGVNEDQCHGFAGSKT